MNADSIIARIPDVVGMDIDPDLRAQLQDPEAIRELTRNPGSKLAGVGSRLITARALQLSWFGLIPSFGLTLLYLNVHFFAQHFAHLKGFAPFGSEWKIWRTVIGWPSFAMKYAELIALILLDILVAIVILTAIVLIGTIVWAIAHPCEFVAAVGHATAVTLAVLGGPLAQAGIVACTIGNAAS